MNKRNSFSSNFQHNISEIQKVLRQRYNVKIYDYTFFISYLLKYDNDLSKCLKKINEFFVYKKTFPEYLRSGDIKEPDFEYFCKSIYSFYLPELTEDGYRIFIDRVTKDERLFDVFKIIKYYCMQTEIRFLENYREKGDIILFDCNHISLCHFIAFIPYFIKALYLILTIYPLRLKLLILTNTGRFMAILINALKFILPEKNREMLIAYAKGTEHFSKHVSANILPTEYGGKRFSMNELREQWFEKLQLNYEWFVKANDEINSMNLEKLEEQVYATFGKNGSFRCLQID